MINTLSVLFSLVAVALVVIRAAVLDRTMPWFQRPQAEPAKRPGRPKQSAP